MSEDALVRFSGGKQVGGVRYKGDKEVTSALGRVGAFFGLSDDRVVRIVGAEIKEGVRENFRFQSSPDGIPWPDLRTGTFGEGRKGYILRDTAKLYNSFALRFDGFSHVSVGTNEIDAATHNFGDPDRHSNRPNGFLAIPVNRQVARTRAESGGFRAAYPDAFVIRMGGSLFGQERAWLVRAADGAARARRGKTFSIGKKYQKAIKYGRGARSSLSGRQKLEFLAHLVKSLSIPARPFMGLRRERKMRIVAVLEIAASIAWRNGK